jgi:hypothetical protein
MSFRFNDGAVATFDIAEDNAIRTVDFENWRKMLDSLGNNV